MQIFHNVMFINSIFHFYRFSFINMFDLLTFWITKKLVLCKFATNSDFIIFATLDISNY